MTHLRTLAFWKTTLFPTRAIALLMAIGFADLASTAILHELGLIVEMNPLMRPFLQFGEWSFVLVKGATLAAAWATMSWYSRHNIKFVKQMCLMGSAVYLTIWMGWFAYGVYA